MSAVAVAAADRAPKEPVCLRPSPYRERTTAFWG
jgi:hypothetical protein